MTSGFSKCLLGGYCLLVLTLATNAEPFVAPTEKISPFRRDRLPIDASTMSSLSRDLVLLAESSSLKKANERRSVSKVLALALALDPSNIQVKDRLSDLSKEGKLDPPDEERLSKSMNKIWNTQKWLASPEAGSDGNLLASLMGETVSSINPEHQRAQEFTEISEHEAWQGWVAEIDKFKEIKVVTAVEKIVELVPEKLTTIPVPQRKPDGNKITLRNAELYTVLHYFNKERAIWLPKYVTIKMETSGQAHDHDGVATDGFRISIPGEDSQYWAIEENLASPVETALTQYFNGFPKNGEIKLLVGEDGYYPYRANRNTISGPAFILSHAALSGKEPAGTVIAELKGDGRWRLPNFSWRLFKELSAIKTGGLLIVPPEAEEDLISLLTLEKPEFFLENEVVIARSTEEFLALSAKNASKEHIEISQKFKAIKDKAEGNLTGAYLANRFVRQRLQEISDQAPYHLSAKMLLLKSSNKRPQFLTDKILAAEIWRIVDVVDNLAKIDNIYISSGQIEALGKIHEWMEKEFDGIERYAENRNGSLMNNSRALISAVRALSKIYSRRGEIWEKTDKIYAAKNEIFIGNRELREMLSKLSGDPLPK